VTDLLQHGEVNGLGREPGVEATPVVPPATHVEVQPSRLCKTSGLTYHYQGSDWYMVVMEEHTVDKYEPRTKRAQFCSDRCRNLWRDTRPARERAETLARGEAPVGYRLIPNYRNSGITAVMNEKSLRVIDY
jgi:hypothetical protein